MNISFKALSNILSLKKPKKAAFCPGIALELNRKNTIISSTWLVKFMHSMHLLSLNSIRLCIKPNVR